MCTCVMCGEGCIFIYVFTDFILPPKQFFRQHSECDFHKTYFICNFNKLLTLSINKYSKPCFSWCVIRWGSFFFVTAVFLFDQIHFYTVTVCVFTC